MPPRVWLRGISGAAGSPRVARGPVQEAAAWTQPLLSVDSGVRRPAGHLGWGVPRPPPLESGGPALPGSVLQSSRRHAAPARRDTAEIRGCFTCKDKISFLKTMECFHFQSLRKLAWCDLPQNSPVLRTRLLCANFPLGEPVMPINWSDILVWSFTAQKGFLSSLWSC